MADGFPVFGCVTACMTLKDGSLYMTSDVCDRYFPGVESVVLLRRDDDLLILPVRHAASGGYLLKRRNRAGDRVVNAAEFFRTHGSDDDRERQLPVVWSEQQGALVAARAFL